MHGFYDVLHFTLTCLYWVLVENSRELKTIIGNVRLSAPVDYEYVFSVSVNNTYSVLQRMGCIRHGADNRI